MRRPIVIAGVMVALSFGGAPAFAFQETPAPPTAEIPQAAPPAEALKLGTPGGVEAPQPDHGGLNLFGYTVLPKLNFGLDVLYGQDQQQLQLGAQDSLGALEEDSDVTVLGKVQRRF